ncbi:MAG: patatin-like phospholipase family protein [Saprospiraceae bacterium]|nr:patatin-like phospholipase family protein [Saprospiraceae bacterium]
MKVKHAIVLSGGGFKGAFQLGAINALSQSADRLFPDGHMFFDIVAGVSVGSLNGALLAMQKLDALNDFWVKVAVNGTKEIFTSPFIDAESGSDEPKFKLDVEQLKTLFPGFGLPKIGLDEMIKLAFMGGKKREKYIANRIEETLKPLLKGKNALRGLADNTPLRDKLRQQLDKNAINGSQYYCGFVSLDDGQYHSVLHSDFTSNEDFVNGVLASTAMPVVWPPVPNIGFAGRAAVNSVDGGIRNVSPLGDVVAAINRDNDPDVEYRVIIINCNCGLGQEDFSEGNVARIALRALNDIAISEIFDNDLAMFLKINDLVDQAEERGVKLMDYNHQNGQRAARPFRSFETMIIQPDAGALGDTLAMNPELYERRMAHGYAKAQEVINQFLREQEMQPVRA